MRVAASSEVRCGGAFQEVEVCAGSFSVFEELKLLAGLCVTDVADLLCQSAWVAPPYSAAVCTVNPLILRTQNSVFQNNDRF